MVVTQLLLSVSGQSIYNYKIGSSHIKKIFIYLQLNLDMNIVRCG